LAFSNVREGEYAVQVTPTSVLPFSTYVADIRNGPRSVLADGLVVSSQPLGVLDVIVRTDGGSVQGTITGAGPGPTLVVLIPSAQRRGNSAFYSGATAYGSSFKMNGIPPGEYKLFAWEGVEGINTSHPYMNADYMGLYENRGVSLKIDANSTITGVKVPVIPIGQ
jgi:hypothetical protein